MAKVGRKSTKTFFISEIAYLSQVQNWGRKRIYLYFVEKSLTDPAYADYPSEATVRKYVAVTKRPTYGVKDLMKEFHYPNDVGQGAAKVPWELARYAMDCLGFYFENYGIRPSIGLAKRYAEVAVLYPPSSTTLNAINIAVIAEKFWSGDLAAAWGKERPSTEWDEFRLAVRAFDSKGEERFKKGLDKMGRGSDGQYKVMPWVGYADPEFLSGIPVFRYTYEKHLEESRQLEQTKKEIEESQNKGGSK